MSLTALLILHLASIIVLLGYTFYAFAAPAETRRRVLMITGIATVLVVMTGFAMLGKLRLGVPGWALVKLGCVLGLGVIGGIAYRMRALADVFMILAFVLAITAVAMVYVRPFGGTGGDGRHALWRLDRRRGQGSGVRRDPRGAPR
jgi:hypothetical protein